MTEVNILIEDIQIPGKTVKIVHISGQLDESNIDEKIQEIYKLMEATPKGLSLIFDLENLEYLNSKSIGYLTDLYGKLTEAGGMMVIAKPKPNITDILQVVGLTQLIKNFDSIDEAKKYISTTTPGANLAGTSSNPATQATPANPEPAPIPTTTPPTTPTPAPTSTPAAPTTLPTNPPTA